jgi:hypothetical protein
VAGVPSESVWQGHWMVQAPTPVLLWSMFTKRSVPLSRKGCRLGPGCRMRLCDALKGGGSLLTTTATAVARSPPRRSAAPTARLAVVVVNKGPQYAQNLRLTVPGGYRADRPALHAHRVHRSPRAARSQWQAQAPIGPVRVDAVPMW